MIENYSNFLFNFRAKCVNELTIGNLNIRSISKKKKKKKK